jgi:putative oxidoreductase
MDEFVKFLQANQFAAPEIMAPLSVYTQFFCGLALVLGLLTRWAGLILAINFVVAVLLVHWSQDFRGWWPAIVLVGIGLQFALTGAGGVSLDAVILRRGESKK